MNINLSWGDIGAIITSVVGVVGPMIWGLLKALQKAQEASLKQKFDGLSKEVGEVASENRTQNEHMMALERTIMKNQVDLAQNYVRRDDFIRIVGSIDGKIDSMALRIERAVISLGGKVQ